MVLFLDTDKSIVECQYQDISQEGSVTYRKLYYRFFLLARVLERVAGFEKCKHIYHILHYFG